MAKFGIRGLQTITWYALLALFLCVAVLPFVKSSYPEVFPTIDGFLNQDLSCQGVTCPEGHFCQQKQCIPITLRYPNAVPLANM
jgi:hypothetical protein